MGEVEGEYLLDGYKALGTVWYVEVFDIPNTNVRDAITKDIEKFIQEFEDKYSRFKETSLVSILNNKRSVSYDRYLFEMLEMGCDAHHKSEGVFSLFIEQQLVEKGYGDNGQRSEGHQVKGQTQTHIKNDTTFTITDSEIILYGDGRVDLGGIGKGYLIDLIKERLQTTWKINQFIINGGGDIYVTHHNNQPIEFYLKHPTVSDEVVGLVMLKDKAFCSSSSYLRTWQQGGVKKNHFITNNGSEVWAASYVIGDTATETDIAATVLCITSDDVIKSKKVAEAFDIEYLVYDKNFKSHGNLVYNNLTL